MSIFLFYLILIIKSKISDLISKNQKDEIGEARE